MSASPPALTDSGAAASVSRRRAKSPWWPLLPLVLGTFLGTLNNNIVNVPMKQILGYFRVPLSEGAFVVIAFNLTFAVLMPVTGWLGDRVGRRRLFCWAVAMVAVGGLGALSAPTLPVLVVFRVVQGVGTAAILPTVMAVIADLYSHEQRGRALGVWAAVNGLGQAVGPPVGGLIASVWSWRLVFVPTLPLAALAAGCAMWLLPRRPARRLPIDWAGVTSLTCGATLVIGAVSLISVFGPLSPQVLLAAVGGAVLMVLFIVGIRRRPRPFIAPRLLVEPSYLRSSLAVFAQMFCLGAMLLGVPLYLTRQLGVGIGRAGILIFALPAVMTLLAPLAGRCAEGWGPRRTLRAGAFVLVLSQLLGLLTFGRDEKGWPLEVALVLAGIGVAFVQTPAATGATRSPAGRVGAGVGLFNLIRFAGSAIGAAWVSITLAGSNRYGLLFAGCLVMSLLGLAGTYAGKNTPPDPPAGEEPLCAVPAGGA